MGTDDSKPATATPGLLEETIRAKAVREVKVELMGELANP